MQKHSQKRTQSPSSVKDNIRHPSLRGIPEQLARYPQWVGYLINAHLAKVPLDAHHAVAGSAASSVDPDTWTDVHEAVGSFLTKPSWDGLGFMLTEEDGILLIDFDNVVYGVEIADWVQELMLEWRGWWQVSSSGTGLHCLLRVPRSVGIESQGRYYGPDMPANPTRADKERFPARVEVFYSKRFVPFSGRPVLIPNGPDVHISSEYGLALAALEKLQPVERTAATSDPRASAGQVVQGERHTWLSTQAGRIARTTEDRSDVRTQIELAAQSMPDPLPPREVEGIINWALDLEPTHVPSNTTTNSISEKRAFTPQEKSSLVHQILALDTVGYECQLIARDAFFHIRDVDWEHDERRWYRSRPIYKHLRKLVRETCPDIKSKRCAPAAWGLLRSTGNVIGSQLHCGNWCCPRCGPYKKAAWWYDLSSQLVLAEEVYHNTLSDEEWARARKSSFQRLRSHKALYRAFKTDRGWDVVSTEPLSGRKLKVQDRRLSPGERPALLLNILERMRARTRKKERLVCGSKAWGPPKPQKPSEDYEFLGVGPSPDAAATMVARELKLATALSGRDVDIDGTVHHWAAKILMDGACGLLEDVMRILGIHQAVHWCPEPEPAPPPPPWDR